MTPEQIRKRAGALRRRAESLRDAIGELRWAARDAGCEDETIGALMVARDRAAASASSLGSAATEDRPASTVGQEAR